MGLDESGKCRRLNQLTKQIIEKKKNWLLKVGRIGTFIMCIIPPNLKTNNNRQNGCTEAERVWYGGKIFPAQNPNLWSFPVQLWKNNVLITTLLKHHVPDLPGQSQWAVCGCTRTYSMQIFCEYTGNTVCWEQCSAFLPYWHPVKFQTRENTQLAH